MSAEERRAIPGVGAAIADKIEQLLATGTIETLERLREKTPAGIRDMLGIKGLGPKKIEVLWKTLGVESAGELMYACTENRLIELPGFGPKTQADVLAKLEFFQAHRDRFLYASIEEDAGRILAELQRSNLRVELTGALRRRDPVIEAVELLVEGSPGEQAWPESLVWQEKADDRWTGQWEERFPVVLYWQGRRTWGAAQLRTTGDGDFLEALSQKSQIGPE
jgi:DNA polymerase (family X)